MVGCGTCGGFTMKNIPLLLQYVSFNKVSGPNIHETLKESQLLLCGLFNFLAFCIFLINFIFVGLGGIEILLMSFNLCFI